MKYAVQGDALVNRLFVTQGVRGIFEYRTERLLEALG